MKIKDFIIGGLLLCAAVAAYSDTNTTTDVTSTVVSQIQTAATSATTHLTTQALKWCGIFATLQFIMSNIKIIRESGDLPQVVAKLTGSIMWVGVVIYLINNGPTFIRNVGNQLQGLTGVTLPTPGSILETTFSLGGVGALLAASTGPLAPVAGDILWDVDMLLMGIGIYFACKLFMMQLEVALIAMMAPLSFSFLGLNAFRDQGFAPFKSLVALSFRIVLVGVIIQAYQGIFSDLQTTWSGLTWNQVLINGVGSTIETTLTDLGAVIVLAFVMFKSDSIASALASGSSSLGPGDVMQAAAAGAALGAAAHVSGSAVKATEASNEHERLYEGLDGRRTRHDLERIADRRRRRPIAVCVAHKRARLFVACLQLGQRIVWGYLAHSHGKSERRLRRPRIEAQLVLRSVRGGGARGRRRGVDRSYYRRTGFC